MCNCEAQPSTSHGAITQTQYQDLLQRLSCPEAVTVTLQFVSLHREENQLLWTLRLRVVERAENKIIRDVSGIFAFRGKVFGSPQRKRKSHPAMDAFELQLTHPVCTSPFNNLGVKGRITLRSEDRTGVLYDVFLEANVQVDDIVYTPTETINGLQNPYELFGTMPPEAIERVATARYRRRCVPTTVLGTGYTVMLCERCLIVRNNDGTELPCTRWELDPARNGCDRCVSDP